MDPRMAPLHSGHAAREPTGEQTCPARELSVLVRDGYDDYAEWDRNFGGSSGTFNGALATLSDDRVVWGLVGSRAGLLANWATAHDEAPHGPSHIAPMAMQLFEAIASGAATPHTTTAITATTTRQCFILHDHNTVDAARDSGTER